MRRFVSARWLFTFALWTIYGLATAWQSHFRAALRGKPLTWTSALLAELAYSYIWAAITPFVLLLGKHFPLIDRRWVRNIGVHLAGMMAAHAVTKLTWDYAVFPLLFTGDHRPPIGVSLGAFFEYGFVLYWMILSVQTGALYYRSYIEAQTRGAKLEAQLAQARLDALKFQLQPHFLFNTLNTISAMIHEDPEGADRMVVRLSELLRMTLASGSGHERPLSQEMDFIRSYLAIEKERFEERLDVDLQVDPETLGAMVPTLILQPLVENAIRHGISRSTRNGRVSIFSYRQNGHLRLEVRDTGAELPEVSGQKLREGVGLSNTRARLERLYGDDHQFFLRRSEDGGTKAEIVVPFRSEDSHAGAHRG